MRQRQWGRTRARTASVTLFFYCTSLLPVTAGDMDTHLTSTYFLARKAGFSEADAQRIAGADWSMDLSRNTNALPNGPISMWGVPNSYYQRGQTYHSLGNDPDQIVGRLEDLRNGVLNAPGPRQDKLVQLGEYLHATQDVYFHQHDGQPYGPKIGHGLQGHDTDRVAAHYDSALRANDATYKVLQAYKDNGSLPSVARASDLYVKDTTAQTDAIRANNKTVVALTDAVSNSYSTYKVPGFTPPAAYAASGLADPTTERTVFVDPKPDVLKKNLDAAWNQTGGGKGGLTEHLQTPDQMVNMKQGTPGSFDYYNNKDHAKLLLTPGQPTSGPQNTQPSTPTINGTQPSVPAQTANNTQPSVTTTSPGTTSPTITTKQPTTPTPTTPTTTSPGTSSPTTANNQPSTSSPTTPTTTTPSTTKPTQVAMAGPTAGTLPAGPAPAPGGISLSLAAAQRLAINVNLDGLYTSDGRIVLSGRSDKMQRVEAPLFYTAVRLACERNDPYFSLDSDNGKLWTDEGRQASDAIWPRIRADYGLEDPLKNGSPDGLTVRSLSAKRDFPQLWAKISPQYPNFKTRLVFRPEWLRLTRFGEILYKADILLKELDGGVPTLRPDPKLRANNIGLFASATARGAAASLFKSVSGDKTKPEFHGSRLWFDLAPKANAPAPGASMLDDMPSKPAPTPAASRVADPVAAKVFANLTSEGYVGRPRASEPKRALSVDGNAVDLSQVYPQMFVRAHDIATHKDIPGMSPTLNALSEDVNARIKQYVEAYDELRELTEAFRLYVAAVAFTKRDDRICESVQATPLLASEKLREPLPEFHYSELYFVFATYKSSSNAQKRWWMGSSSSSDGGVSPRGKEFFERESTIPERTAVTKEVEREATATTDKGVWKGTSGRENVALVPDLDREFIRQAEFLKSFKPVTREMVMARAINVSATSSPGAGLLDEPVAGPQPKSSASPGKGGGMLDDLDPNARGVLLVPGRL